jgi:hypothetical protein
MKGEHDDEKEQGAPERVKDNAIDGLGEGAMG